MNDAWLKCLAIVAGLVLLVGGGELLVRGASRLAAVMRISSLVIGLTIVAFGTSAPELAVSVQASLEGNPDLAIGNVVGSNIFNVLFILGVSALIVPLVVSSQLIRFDVPIMIGSSVLALVFGWNGTIDRIEGSVLFAGILVYTIWCIRQSRKESREVVSEFDQEFKADESGKASILTNLFLIGVGLGVLVLGSRLLIDGAVWLAASLGVSELVIGLTIVAAGTSLPEVVTSIVAAIRGERDIAVGNVVGSNIFNILCVLGLSAVVASDGVTVSAAVNSFDCPVMIAVAFACLPIFFTGQLISRWEGALFLFYYVAYTAYLVFAATGSDLLNPMRDAMLFFILPLTALTLVVTAWRSPRKISQ